MPQKGPKSSKVKEGDYFVNVAWYFTSHSQNQSVDEETGKIPGYLFIIPPGKEPSDNEIESCVLDSVEGYINGEPQYTCDSGGKVTSDLLGSTPNKFVRYLFEDGTESSAWVRFQFYS